MQQMPIDRWNKFELVVLSIDTLLCYEIPRLSKWFHIVINHFVMQQMPIDRWNKFEFVVLSIDTLLYYKIPRLYQSDFITLWNTCSKRFAMLYHTIQTSSILITISKLSMQCIS
jgi:hypothetical protein